MHSNYIQDKLHLMWDLRAPNMFTMMYDGSFKTKLNP